MRVITAAVALLLALCTAPTAVGEETTPAPTPVPQETVAPGRDGIVPVPTTAPEETVPVPEAPRG